jgi:uncharacterized membrane protein
MANGDTLFVLAAAYPTREAALADYEAVKALYRDVKTSNEFDAAVIEKDSHGRVDIVKRHEEPTRHGAVRGLRWGLAAGVVTALFPPVGIAGALALGAGGGAAIGAVAGHARDGMRRDELKELGEVLDDGTAALVAVYETNLADQVAANINATNHMVSETTVDTERLAKDLQDAKSP